MIAVHEVYMAGAAIVVALIGLAGVWLQIRSTGRKVDKVYDHVNRVEVQTEDGSAALTFREEMRDGFARNDNDHVRLIERTDGQDARLDVHDGRITNVEREVAP